MKKIILKVDGMHCEGCERRIVNSLSLLEDVKEVIPSYIDGIVTIKIDKEIDINVIKEKIEDLGFDVLGEM